MKALRIFNEEDVSEIEAQTYRTRRAVRTIVFDKENKIAIIHVTKNYYHELPGGGVESEESFEQGALREVKEEVGCACEIISEIGTILEYRKAHTMINETHGFVAKLIGEKSEPQLEEDEMLSGMEVVWVSPEEGICLIETSVPKNLYDTYVLERDVTFIREILQKHIN